MSAPDLILVAAYVSLGAELVCFPISSEASVAHLVGGVGSPSSPALDAARRAALARRVAQYLLPTAVCVALFLLPLLVTFAPSTRPYAAPWTAASMVWPGLSLVVVGRVITFGSVLQLRRARRLRQLPGGMFRWSRNPGLVGMFVMYFGLCLAVGGPWLWLGAPLYFANMHARVRLEESDLDLRFGDAWREYTCRAPRYLPVRRVR